MEGHFDHVYIRKFGESAAVDYERQLDLQRQVALRWVLPQISSNH